MSNNAIFVNPLVANADITQAGSSFLFAICAVMIVTGLGVLYWTHQLPVGKRAFHWIGVAILFTAATAYFSMGSDLGSVAIYVEFVRYKPDIFSDTRVNPYTRSIWYVRYIDWAITTPLLLLELLLATGLPLSYIMITIFMDLLMVTAGLMGALTQSSYKWAYFTGSCVAFFFVFYVLLFPARTTAKLIGHHAHSCYVNSMLVLAGLWLLYPVAWGLCEGGNVISSDSEAIFYGVLDLLAKPGFLLFHLFALQGVSYEQLGLQSGHFSVGATGYDNVPAAAQKPKGQAVANMRNFAGFK